jgi:hypothetical protein
MIPHATLVMVLDPEMDADAIGRAVRDGQAALSGSVGILDVVVVANGPRPSEEAVRRALATVSDTTAVFLADAVPEGAAALAGAEAAVTDCVLLADPLAPDWEAARAQLDAFREGARVVLVEGPEPSPARRIAWTVLGWLTGVSEARLTRQCLLGRDVVAYLLRHADAASLLRGLAIRSGFATRTVRGRVPRRPHRGAAAAGHVLDVLTGLSGRPLRFLSAVCAMAAVALFGYALYAALVLLLGRPVEGWFTLSLIVAMPMALLFLVLALLVEHVLRIHRLAARRPEWVVIGEARSSVLRREGLRAVER